MKKKRCKRYFSKDILLTFIVLILLSFVIPFLFADFAGGYFGFPLHFYYWGTSKIVNSTQFFPINLLLDMLIWYVIAILISWIPITKTKRKK